MAGFGTAVAIPAAMMVAVGFDPTKIYHRMSRCKLRYQQHLAPSVFQQLLWHP